MPIEGQVWKQGNLDKDFIAGILKPGKDKHFLSPAQLKYKKILAELMKKMNKKKGGKKSKRNIKMARKFRKSRTRKKRGGGCNCNECLKQCNGPPPDYEELEDEPTMVSFEPMGRHSWQHNPGLKSQEPELEDEPKAVSFKPMGRNSWQNNPGLQSRGGRRRRKRIEVPVKLISC